MKIRAMRRVANARTAASGWRPIGGGNYRVKWVYHQAPFALSIDLSYLKRIEGSENTGSDQAPIA